MSTEKGFAPLLLLITVVVAAGTFYVVNQNKESTNQVLSAQTTSGGFFQQLINKFGSSDRFSTQATAGADFKKTPEPGEMFLKGLNTSNLTDAQKAEIKSRLTAIQIKQQELKALQDSFIVWLKANNIPLPKPSPAFSPKPSGSSKELPHPSPTTKSSDN
jgi:hypothetical protein